MKTILVLLDGLNYRVAHDAMGYLQAECAAGRGRLYLLESELPSLSRPLYECILTGVTPVESGVVHNHVSRLSHQQSVFHYARAARLTTAAAAYHWFSELYNRTPFDAARDRHTDAPELPIQHGHFYYDDGYPDSHLFDDAESLRLRHQPDFLLIHPMNIDDAGHRFGLSSPQYRNAARRADGSLSRYLPEWLAAGYQVLVTADHGMNDDRSHGGVLPEERQCRCSCSARASARTMPIRSKPSCAARSAICCRRRTTSRAAGRCWRRMRDERQTKWIAALCLLPFIVLFGAFQIAPLVWIAVHSFFSETGGWGWGNYVDILTSPFYLQAFQFSLEISLWSSVYGLLIALVGSYSLRQLGQTRFHDFVMSFTNMTSNFAGVPLAFAFVILLGLNGCLTLLLRKYGLMESFNLYSKSGLIVLYTYFQIPLGVLLLYPAFDALRADWRESAALLGAGPGATGGISACRCWRRR